METVKFPVFEGRKLALSAPGIAVPLLYHCIFHPGGAEVYSSRAELMSINGLGKVLSQKTA